MATPDATQQDARTLLELAVDIHTDLGKLATGLAHAGANPQAVATLQRMDAIIADVAKLLGSGPVGASPQPGGEAAQPGAEQAPQAAPTSSAPVAAVGGPPQGVTPGERPSGFHEATAQLQAALASKHAAAQRALAGNQ